MTGRRRGGALAVSLVGAVVVGAAVALRAAGGAAYSLAGWPGDPDVSAVLAWVTWGAAAAVVLAVTWSDTARAVRVALVAAAILVVLEEGDRPGLAMSSIATVAVLSGAVLPGALGAVTVGGSRIERGRWSWLTWSLLALGAACGVAGAVLVDPRLHGCPSCAGRGWGSVDHPAAAAGLTALGVLLVVGASLPTSVAAASSRRWTGIRWSDGLVVIGGLVSLATVARSRWSGPLETPIGPSRALVVSGLVLATIGALWPGVDAARRRARLVRVVARVAARGMPTDVEGALRRALRDPCVEVGYVTNSDGLVDLAGVPLSTDGRHVVTVERDGQHVLTLAAASPLDQEEADLAVALAWPVLEVQLESARLAVAARHLTIARRASVEEADRAARVLGRDLHDGAQQQLVSLMIGIRVAADRAGGSPELEAALGDVQSALDEVRRIAHGDLPPILSEQGLSAALVDLVADRIGISVDVDPRCVGIPAVLRNTIYLVVLACVRDSWRALATMSVRVWPDGAVVRLLVKSEALRDNVHVSEAAEARVRALGGEYVRDGDRLRVALPCD